MPFSRGSSDPGIKPMSLMSPALASGFFTASTTWEASNNQLELGNCCPFDWVWNVQGPTVSTTPQCLLYIPDLLIYPWSEEHVGAKRLVQPEPFFPFKITRWVSELSDFVTKQPLPAFRVCLGLSSGLSPRRMTALQMWVLKPLRQWGCTWQSLDVCAGVSTGIVRPCGALPMSGAGPPTGIWFYVLLLYAQQGRQLI